MVALVVNIVFVLALACLAIHVYVGTRNMQTKDENDDNELAHAVETFILANRKRAHNVSGEKGSGQCRSI